jgi:hypothetical protein
MYDVDFGITIYELRYMIRVLPYKTDEQGSWSSGSKWGRDSCRLLVGMAKGRGIWGVGEDLPKRRQGGDSV